MQSDWLWVRILDVVRALEARTYEGEGALVLEVVDGSGMAGGRYRLEASPAGATCTATTRSADLTLDVRELATLWLGDESVARLVALGRVREERAGAGRGPTPCCLHPGVLGARTCSDAPFWWGRGLLPRIRSELFSWAVQLWLCGVCSCRCCSVVGVQL